MKCESDCYEISSPAANIVEELNSTQEEADTRLILHAAHVAKSGYKAVVMTVLFFFFLNNTSEQHFINRSCQLALFFRPVSSNHTDFIREFEQDT